MNNHFMIDIETTGTNPESDDILEIALVEIEFTEKNGKLPFWHPTGRNYHTLVHSKREPANAFAREHMTDLYKACNEVDESRNVEVISKELYEFIHAPIRGHYALKAPELPKPEEARPKYFMGWNASNFDIPMITSKGFLRPCFYTEVNGKEELRGDVHYRVYEQTGSLNIVRNMSGLSNETLKVLAVEIDPTGISLPNGKQHDALYDCYWQIKMMNGLIEIGRRGWVK